MTNFGLISNSQPLFFLQLTSEKITVIVNLILIIPITTLKLSIKLILKGYDTIKIEEREVIMKEYNTIKIEEREDGIAIITLNRPNRLNAWTAVFLEEMLHYLNYLDDNVKIRVVIITGAGRAFSSGLDLKDSHKMFLENVPEEYQNIKYLHLKDIKTRNVFFQEMIGR